MVAVMQGIEGPGISVQISLEDGQCITVGRLEDCTVPIPGDRFISGRHFKIAVNEGRIYLSDLNSSNGTFVNGIRVHAQVLNERDTVTAGETTFRIQSASSKLLDVVEALSSQQEPLYAVLDAARDPTIYTLLVSSETRYWCLYHGRSATELETVAPYLVSLPPGCEFLKILAERGWANSWGIFLTSRQPVEIICRELRRSLFVTLENHEQVYFRFYDPRVLRAFLPVADSQQRMEFSGTISSFLIEDEDSTILLRFHSLRKTCGLDKITVKCTGAATDKTSKQSFASGVR